MPRHRGTWERRRPTTATPHDGNAPLRQRRQKFSGQVPENRRNWELEPMVPNFVDRTGGSKWPSALPTGKPETLAAFPCMVECIEIPAILLGLRGSRWVQAQPARLLSRLTATAPLSWEPYTLQNHVSPERGGARNAGGGVRGGSADKRFPGKSRKTGEIGNSNLWSPIPCVVRR